MSAKFVINGQNRLVGEIPVQGAKNSALPILAATVLVDNAVMVFLNEGQYFLRKVKLQDGGRVLMQWYDYEPRSEVVPAKQLTLAGRVRRVEFDL